MPEVGRVDMTPSTQIPMQFRSCVTYPKTPGHVWPAQITSPILIAILLGTRPRKISHLPPLHLARQGQPLCYQDRLAGFMSPCLIPATFSKMKKVSIPDCCSVISVSQPGLPATAAVHVVTVTSWLYIFSWALLSQSKPRQRAWENILTERCQTSAIPHVILSLSFTPTLPEVPWRTVHGYNSGTVTRSYVSNIHLIPISCRKLL